jgi:hypothetical protein
MKRLLATFVALVALVAFVAPVAFAQNSASNSGLITSSGSSCSTPTNCVVLVLPSDASTAAVTLAGTFSATVQFEMSADGVNFVAANAAPQPTGATVNSATAAGTWSMPVAGMTYLRTRASSFSSGQVNVFLQATSGAAPFSPSTTSTVTLANTAGTGDPCQNPSVAKSSAAIAISSATTTQLVGLSGSTVVYVCGFLASATAGTNPSLQFEYGTGSSCGTGTTVLTGAMATGVTVSATAPGPIFADPRGATAFKTAAGNALCAVTAGTTPNFQGYVTFVQQ